jgi:hypothetical protein
MVEPISSGTLKAGAAMAAPTGRVLREVLKDRKRCKCMAGYLRTAIAGALVTSAPDVKSAISLYEIDDIVKRALGRAYEEANGTSWRRLPQRIIGKVRRRTQDLSFRTTADMQNVIIRWIKAGLPPGDYNWNDLAERSAEGFRRALYEEQQKEVVDSECAAFAIELEKAFQENDVLWEAFSQKQDNVKEAAITGVGGAIISGILGTVGEVQYNSDLLAAAGGILGLSLITAIWLGAKAHQKPRWDQAAALEFALDTARDWLRDVYTRNLDLNQAQQLLRERVVPRLADWDVPVLIAILYRIVDQLEDRARMFKQIEDGTRFQYNFSDHRLDELFVQAAQLLSRAPDMGVPASRQSLDMVPVPIQQAVADYTSEGDETGVARQLEGTYRVDEGQM